MALRNNRIVTRWTNTECQALITIRANTNNQYWYNNYGNYYYNIIYCRFQKSVVKHNNNNNNKKIEFINKLKLQKFYFIIRYISYYYMLKLIILKIKSQF